MTKKNFITLLLGVIGGLLFSIGMCMCLLVEWNAFETGVVVTAIGAVILLTVFLVRWTMDGKKLKFNWKLIGKIAFGTFASLVLGVGMCMIMVFNMMIPGIIVGVVGIALLLCLIPMCIGLK